MIVRESYCPFHPLRTLCSVATRAGASLCLIFFASAGLVFGQDLPNFGGRVVKVAVDREDYRPFYFSKDGDGRLYGFEPDLLSELAKLLNFEVSYQRVDWDMLLVVARQGDVDLAMSAIDLTPERKSIMTMSAPYAEDGRGIGVAIVFADESTLLEPFNDALDVVKANGTLAGLQSKWPGVDYSGVKSVEEVRGAAGTPDN